MTMIITKQKARKLENNDRVWSRIYAPLRRTLAGTWVKASGDDRFQLTLDAFGGFHLRHFDTDTDQRGRYTISGSNGEHYLALHGPSSTQILRIEDVDSISLRLAMDEKGKVLDLTRRR